MSTKRRPQRKHTPRRNSRTNQTRPQSHAQSRARTRAPNAAAEAAAYLATTRQDGIPTLAFWRGSWHRWRASAYHVVPQGEIRAELVRWLTPRRRTLTSNFTSNVLDCLAALALVPGSVDQPSWRDDDARTPPRWPAGEMLATPRALIHLPSFSAAEQVRSASARTTSSTRRKSKTVPRPKAGALAARPILPPTPRFFNSTALEFDFDADAPPPVEWLRFLHSLWRGDEQRVELLQDWFGYLLTHDTSQQKILLVVGPRRSGKGTIARVVRSLIGPANVAAPTLSSLGTKFGLWPLVDKSLAIIPDARLSARADGSLVTERLLSTSGEDLQTVERKHQRPVTLRLPTRLMILTNELPRLGDSSGALASRILLLRMERSFLEREDLALATKLLAELPSILRWAIVGWQRLRTRAYFIQPESGHDLLDELDDLASPVSAFIKERCEVGRAEWRTVASDLFAAWIAWCKASGRRDYGNVQTFGRDLKAALPALRTVYPRAIGYRRRAYDGIRLANGN